MRFYLTTPIYYVNSTPHIGHAYTTIAADIVVRHHRQRGDATWFLTGVDEHADKVARVAAEQGLEPRAYTDQIVTAWQELPRRVNATNDFFIRTSDDGHKAFVQEFLQRIKDNGRDDIYQDVYAGLYCVGCEAFKTPEELVDGKCPDHGTVPEWIEERNWFFRLSAYQDQLLALYDERPDLVLPQFRYNEARSFIEGGLRDFSISRATQTWGVPIPWDPEQVAYVWADALINYLSALSYAPGEDLEQFWPAVHFLAKDILRFHCVYWPAMLLAAGYEPPRQLFVHGYLNIDQQKISKSLGNAIDPLDLIDVYGADAVRFWCARQVSFGQDGNVSLDSFGERYDSELANDLGNLISRTTAMIARYRGGRLQRAPGPGAFDAAALREEIVERFDRYDITGALDSIWQAVRALNQYVESAAPWNLAKDASRAAELDAVLYDLADGIVAVAVALAPYLPETAPRILEALRQSDDLSLERVAVGVAEATDGIDAAQPLFPRVDAPAPAA
ncbi:MAG TPA: methionine--tRNA ligase [Gaiellaceae bacterium]|jgi:methionyl-tRNA synthetase|nr:methionine--tRNA ligase [Gaiellaceae bacterium]